MRSLQILCLLACLAATAGAAGPERSGSAALQDAILRTRADIERATETLTELRADIAEQRRPLAERLESLQNTVKQRRAEVERIRRIRRQGEQEQAALRAEAAAIEDQGRFLQSLFAEYARAMETRVAAAETGRLLHRLRPLQTALAGKDSLAGLAGDIGRLLDLSAEFNAERLGGYRFEGAALDADGIEQGGRFAVLGPAAWFAAADGGPAGLAVTRFGAAEPGIYANFSEAERSAIRRLVETGAAPVPLDVTGGDAIKVQDARPTLLEQLKQGGFVIYPLLAVALAAALLTLYKTVQLGRIRVRHDERIAAVLDSVHAGDAASARRQAEAIREPLRSLVREAVEHRTASRDHLEELMHEQVLACLPRLERHLGTLAVLGGIAPLLGLLGTVTGMIHTFQLVTVFGSGDAKLLSGGISEALVTTMVGLAIAIPVLLAHAFLARRARGIVGTLESEAVRIVNRIKGQGETA